MKLECLFINPPTKGKFIAFYLDGSGAGLYCLTDSGKLLDAEGCECELEELPDAGYGQWAQLPDDFVMWFERE